MTNQLWHENDISSQSDSFAESLYTALEHFQDVVFLGEKSPIASPYLLGHYLSKTKSDAKSRGVALQRVLQDALSEMDYADAGLHRSIIRERFFRGQSAVQVRQLDKVSLGKTQYFTHQKRAVAQFEPYVLRKLNPAIRLEKPLTDTQFVLDRDKQIQACLNRLKMNQVVMFFGASGTGKTTVGSRVTELWGDNTLWFTVRLGINDHYSSFLFDLAYFCHLGGASWLWQELIASNGQLQVEKLAGVIRHTIESLQTKPLICIDEIDLLSPASDGNHAQFVQILNLLRGHIPMLLLGQNRSFEADYYEEMSGFSTAFTAIFLKHHSINLDENSLERLVEYTNGNPRLLTLSAVLHQAGEPFSEFLNQLKNSPTIKYLLGRILQRLDEVEIGILMALSMFNTPAPADVWMSEPKHSRILTSLIQKRLIQYDTQGAVFLLPAYRETLITHLPDEKRINLHKWAARLFQQRGKYTFAAYHLIQTDSPEVAIWLWRDVQQQEISRGQAYTALKLFRTLDAMPLSTMAKEQVKIFCATLENLVGSSATAQDDLRSILWQTPLLQLEANELNGVIANNHSDFDEAERLFKRSIIDAEQMLEVRLAHLRKGLGWRYRSERKLEQAWHSVSLAQYEVENLQGEIQFMRCEYEDAILRLQKALELAHRFEYEDGKAKSYNNLGRISTTIGRFDNAEHYYHQAEAIYKKIGKVNALDGMKINRAFMYNLSGKYKKALEITKTLKTEQQQFETDPSSAMLALLEQNLAEAYLGLRELEQAELCVQSAISYEEISILPDSLRTYGEIKLQQGYDEEAELLIRNSIDLLEQNDDLDTYLLAYSYRALAQVLNVQSEITSATEAQKQAIDLFSEINLQNEVDKTCLLNF